MVYDAVGTHKSKIMSLAVFKKHIGFDEKKELTFSNTTSNNSLVVFGPQLPTLKGIQNILVKEAMKRSNNNQSVAAQILGVTRQALNKRISLLKSA